jgi:Protein of unknown function (DUF2868)
MNKRSARIVCLVKAYESASVSPDMWLPADSARASDLAAQEVGANSSDENFILRRALLAWDKITARQPNLKRLESEADWHRWFGRALVMFALVSGILVDQVGPDNLINLTSLPLFGLLLWNLAVYAFLLIEPLRRRPEHARSRTGPIRGIITAIIERFGNASASAGDTPFLTMYWNDWTRVAHPLAKTYVSRVLHLAAAAFAAGLIVSLYYRGFFNEYVAGWRSTFGPAAAHAVQLYASAVLGLIPSLFSMPPPSTAEISMLDLARHPAGVGAAPWIHRIAVTVGFIVVLPRLLLAAWARLEQYLLERTFPLDLREPYYQHLLRHYRGSETKVLVIPYNYQVSPQVALGLNDVVRELFDPESKLEIHDPIALGQEDNLASDIFAKDYATRFVLFSLTSTPEDESHGLLLRTLAKKSRRASTVGVVDESAFVKRFENQPDRLDERRKLWIRLFEAAPIAYVFCDLSQPEAASAFAKLDIGKHKSSKGLG